jgi:putative transposase
VALAALTGDRTANDLASQYTVNPTLIQRWKKHLLADAQLAFVSRAKAGARTTEARQAELDEQIGRLLDGAGVVERKSPPSAEALQPLIETDHPQPSVRRRCALIGLTRSSLIYQPAAESPENLRLMRLIVQEFAADPFYGSRRLDAWLVEQGEAVSCKLAQRLMGRMKLKAIYPDPPAKTPSG